MDESTILRIARQKGIKRDPVVTLSGIRQSLRQFEDSGAIPYRTQDKLLKALLFAGNVVSDMPIIAEDVNRAYGYVQRHDAHLAVLVLNRAISRLKKSRR